MLPYSKWYRSVPQVLRTGVGGIRVGCIEGSENLAGSGGSEKYRVWNIGEEGSHFRWKKITGWQKGVLSYGGQSEAWSG